MLKNYPIKINDTAIPFPKTWSEDRTRIASNFQTESGKRKSILVRNARKTWSGSWVVTSSWLKRFEDYRTENTLTLKVYDASTDAYKSHTVSISDESFRFELIEGSEMVGRTNGLYNVSFELEEF